MSIEKQTTTSTENKEIYNFERDAFIVGDSLSVGITSGIDKYNGLVKGGEMISTMIKKMEANQEKIKNSKVVFFLGGTNDINSDRSAESIITQIQKAQEIAKRNNAKFVVGTIPPIEKVAIGNIEKANETLKKVNEYIKANHTYIDYNSLLASETDSKKINPKYSAKDGIHMNGAGYSIMRNAMTKFNSMQFENSEEFKKISEQIENLKNEVGAQNPEKIKNIQAEIKKLPEDAKKELQSQLIDVIRSTHADKIFEDIKSGKNIADEKTKKEIEKILFEKNRENFSDSDLLTLRKKGVDIASLTLIDKNEPNKIVSSKEIKEGDNFIVNFGKNDSLRRKTGAGDILPPTVRTVKINGIEAERQNDPRPGYYSINEKGKKQYQPIYDGFSIEVIKTGEATEEDKKANESRWKEARIKETMNNGFKALTDNPDDQEIFKEAEKLKDSTRRNYKELDLTSLEKGDRGLLDFIAKAEGASSYNAIFGDGKGTKINLTSMSLSEVLKAQAEHAKKTGSSAFGRYQFIQDTLKGMIKKYDIPMNAKFDEELQDKLALLLLKEKGLDKFKSGIISLERFQFNLSQTWASIAKDDSGLSYYHGDKMNNKATTAGRQVKQVLETLYT